MNRAVTILIAALMWLGVIVYTVVAMRYARDRRSGISVQNIDIRVADEGRVRVATADSVRGWLAESGLGILGRPVDDIDTGEIEGFLAAHQGVKSVRVRTDLSGNLRVRVSQRIPLARVESSRTGENFWVTRDGWILSDRGDFSAPDTMLVRGDVPVPFDASHGVEYAAVERQNFAEYLEQFTALHNELQRLTTERAATQSALRTTRGSGPKRFWGRTRKLGFEHRKAERIEALTAELATQDRALKNLRAQTVSTRENEKISHKNLAFLPKLANFVKFVVDSDFWSTKIAMLRVVDGELVVVPKDGNHTVFFGALDGTEMEKLSKLEAFYKSGEWAKYRVIDVKYKDQIVCRVN